MATIKAYVSAMLAAERAVGDGFGVDLSRATQAERILNKALLAIIAVLAKTLTGNGVLTDAQLQAELDAAVSTVLDPEPPEPPPPGS